MAYTGAAFKLVDGKLFDTDGRPFLHDHVFSGVDEALAWLLVIGMSGVMVYE